MKTFIGAILLLIFFQSASRAIPNGEVDDSDQFTDVVRLDFADVNKGSCTGILVSRRTVLTAGQATGFALEDIESMKQQNSIASQLSSPYLPS